MVRNTSDNRYGPPRFIVDTDPSMGSHTTIQAAIDDAETLISGGSPPSGVVIQIHPPNPSGTYTENLTISEPGIEFVGHTGDESTGFVRVVGKITFNPSGTCSFSNLRLVTNGDYLFEDTGSNSGSAVFVNVFIHMNDNDAIHIDNANRSISFRLCQFSSAHATGKMFTCPNVNQVSVGFCQGFTSAQPASSTFDSGSLFISNSRLVGLPITHSGLSSELFNSDFDTFSQNLVTYVTSGSGGHTMKHCSFESGTAQAITIGSGTTVNAEYIGILSTNTPAIGGTGTLQYSSISMIGGNTNITGPSLDPKPIRVGNIIVGINYSVGDLLYASGTNALSKRAIGTTGQYLKVSSGVPTWSTISPDIKYFRASDFDALETNFAPLVQDNGSNVRQLVRAFNDSTVEYVNMSFQVPSDFNESGTITFRVWMYAATAAASKNVELEFEHIGLENSESWDQALVAVNSGDLAMDATQDDLTMKTWTVLNSTAGWEKGDYVEARLSRTAPSANNLSGDLYVVAFAIELPRA